MKTNCLILVLYFFHDVEATCGPITPCLSCIKRFHDVYRSTVISISDADCTRYDGCLMQYHFVTENSDKLLFYLVDNESLKYYIETENIIYIKKHSCLDSIYNSVKVLQTQYRLDGVLLIVLCNNFVVSCNNKNFKYLNPSKRVDTAFTFYTFKERNCEGEADQIFPVRPNTCVSTGDTAQLKFQWDGMTIFKCDNNCEHCIVVDVNLMEYQCGNQFLTHMNPYSKRPVRRV